MCLINAHRGYILAIHNHLQDLKKKKDSVVVVILQLFCAVFLQ